MSEIKLPPLPEPTFLGDDVSYGHDAEQMRDYATQAVRDDRKLRELSEADVLNAIGSGWPKHIPVNVELIFELGAAILAASRDKAASADGKG
jgi:hypothetical protein